MTGSAPHRPGYWFFGHPHRPLSARIHDVPVINVSLGTPDEVPMGEETDRLLRGLIFTGAGQPSSKLPFRRICSAAGPFTSPELPDPHSHPRPVPFRTRTRTSQKR